MAVYLELSKVVGSAHSTVFVTVAYLGVAQVESLENLRVAMLADKKDF